MKRTPLKRKSPMKRASMKNNTYKRKTPPRVFNTINQKSAKKKLIEKQWSYVTHFLFKWRSQGKCEICGQYIGSIGLNALNGHHIIKRSQGGKHTIDNCLVIGYYCCHRHDLYADGTPLDRERQLELCAELNKKMFAKYPDLMRPN